MTQHVRAPRTIALLLAVLALAAPLLATDRTEVRVPDLPGYTTLKGDFHMHTIFSDGGVMPEIRVEEAWRDGLDVIAITDHVEHQTRNGTVIKKDQNRAYAMAKPFAEKRHLLIIRGCEITRNEPFGHANALGLNDVNPVNQNDDLDAVRTAFEQGAFIQWNHPDPLWSEVQQKMLDNGWLKGIEVFNGNTFYPHAMQWCLDHHLTMMANSDTHDLITDRFDILNGALRAMTLVFAESRTEQGVLDALRAGRTVCFANGTLAGRAEYLDPLFHAALDVVQREVTLDKRDEVYVDLRNTSSVPFTLEVSGAVPGIHLRKTIVIPAGKTAALSLDWAKDAEPKTKKEVALPFKVLNLLCAPDTPLEVTLPLTVIFP